MYTLALTPSRPFYNRMNHLREIFLE
jgi:hypothetical protein